MTHTKVDKISIQKILIPVTALTILLLILAWLAGSFNKKVAPALNELTSNTLSATTIVQSNSYTIKATKEAIFEPVSASLKAKQATVISARILARIEQINTRAGKLVKKGDLLVQLEKNDLQAQVLQAQQNVNAMQAQDIEAKQNLDRAVELFKKKLISTFELDKNRANYQTIKAKLIAARQALSHAKTTLSYATLIAPINGRIIDRFAEPGDTAQPGVKLLTLYNPFSLRVEAQVREQLALTLTNGQNIEVELPSVNKTILGEIEEIVPAANTGSRSFLIKVRISYHEDLLPGMYARMLIPAGKKTKLTIPKNKVLHVGQLDLVWVIVDGEPQRRLVRLGKENDNDNEMVTILSGLIVGDKVITP